MNKKGVEDLLMNVIYLVMIAIILAMFSVWISGLMSGKLTKAQLLSKEIALVIDSAEPETILSISHYPGNISIDTGKREVTILIERNEFSYDYFSHHKISVDNLNETFAIIRVEK